MECEQFRERMAEDPAWLDEELTRHGAVCPSCKAYAARLARAETRIQHALRFDVGAVKTAAQHTSPITVGPSGRLRWAGLAAGIVAVAAVWLTMTGGPQTDVEDLVAEVVEHWYEEPQSWVETDFTVSTVALNAALDGKANLDLTQLSPISYAQSCLVGGQWVPHLVVQGQQGPVMLLLIPERSIESPIPLSLPSKGLGGRLVPHRGGSIAVLGEDGEQLAPIEAQIARAVEWSI